MAKVDLLPIVLVADADPDTRSLYREFLGARGYDVIEAADGADALAKALNRGPLLIITEIRLPAIDGFGLCEVLRRDRVTAKTPIIVVTSEIRPAELERVVALGASAVLTKPASLEGLFEQMDRLLLGAAAVDGTPSYHSPGGRRQRLSRTHDRYETVEPPSPPPALRCTLCDAVLEYDSSHVGGVNKRNPEQWDYYVCGSGCGRFQYRQRTRQCRRVA
jgi:CheY-like chemotaxis protein